MSLIASIAKIFEDTTTTFSNTGYAFLSMEAYIMCMVVFVILFNRQQNSSDQTEARVVWSRMLFVEIIYCLTKFLSVLIDVNIIPNSDIAKKTMIGINLLSFVFAGLLMIKYMILTRHTAHLNTKRAGKNKTRLLTAVYVLVIVSLIWIQTRSWKNTFLCYVMIIADIIMYLNYSESLVSIDPLTKIPNKNGLYRSLSEIFNDENSKLDLLHVFMIDVDGMSVINSRYGRHEGDKALKIIAGAFKKFRDEEHQCYISRYYGDDFVITAEVENRDDRELFIEHIRNYISNAAMSRGLPYHLRVNIGWAKYEHFSKTETIDGIIDEAENSLNNDREQRQSQAMWKK